MTEQVDVRQELSDMRKAIQDLTVTVARIDERTLEGKTQMTTLRTELHNNYVSTLELTPIKANIAKLENDLAAEKKARENWQTWALRVMLVGAGSFVIAGFKLKGVL